jgi:hypothetical protein
MRFENLPFGCATSQYLCGRKFSGFKDLILKGNVAA